MMITERLVRLLGGPQRLLQRLVFCLVEPGIVDLHTQACMVCP
jgi:hypothetical protein